MATAATGLDLPGWPGSQGQQYLKSSLEVSLRPRLDVSPPCSQAAGNSRGSPRATAPPRSGSSNSFRAVGKGRARWAVGREVLAVLCCVGPGRAARPRLLCTQKASAGQRKTWALVCLCLAPLSGSHGLPLLLTELGSQRVQLDTSVIATATLLSSRQALRAAHQPGLSAMQGQGAGTTGRTLLLLQICPPSPTRAPWGHPLVGAHQAPAHDSLSWGILGVGVQRVETHGYGSPKAT